jgi:hypothetical protein
MAIKSIRASRSGSSETAVRPQQVKPGGSCGGLDKPVAEIVPNTQPAFAQRETIEQSCRFPANVDPAVFGFSEMKNRALTLFAGYGLR